jgi:hypothetical protein
VIQRLFLSLVLGWSIAAATFGSAFAAHAQEPPEVGIDPAPPPPASPPQANLDRSLRRAEARLDAARHRLARAERDRTIATSRQSRLLQLEGLRRTRANRLGERAARAQKRADAAEAQMVKERRDALEEVRVQRAAHSTELLNWLNGRVNAFVLALWLLLMAFLAAAWRPLVGWLALRRAGGLEGATYAKALAVAAAAVAGGAAAAAYFTGLGGAFSPLAVPLIAAGVISIGLITWRASSVEAGSARAEVAVPDRRVVPGIAVVLALVMGLGIGLIGVLNVEPAERRVAAGTAALARLAEPDPTARPTPRVARLRREAERAAGLARRAQARIATAQSDFDLP